MTLSAKNCRLVSKGYYFIPLEYLAKALDISKTTAFNFKKEALKYGFIDCVRNIFDVTDNTGKPIPVEAYGVYLKFYSKKNRLRKGKKYLKEVGSDLINGNVKLKKFRF